MAATSNYLALDLGAESGRGLLGRFDGERLAMDEVHRFPNGPVHLFDTLHWDLPRLFEEVKTAIHSGATRGGPLDGVGVDTWGVDFGLVGRGNTILGNPVHYRDARTNGMVEAAFARVSRERIYEITGLQFLPFNTIYQLLALATAQSPLLEVAETLLLMPDLFGWLLTGRRVCRAHECFDDAVARAAQGRMVERALRGTRAAAGDLAPAGRGGKRTGADSTFRRAGTRASAHDQRDRAGHARHRQRRGRRAGQVGCRCIIPIGDDRAGLVLPELGNLVAAGRRGPTPGHHRGHDEI